MNETIYIFKIFLVMLCGLLLGILAGFYLRVFKLWLQERKQRKLRKQLSSKSGPRKKAIKKKNSKYFSKTEEKSKKENLLTERSSKCSGKSFTKFICESTGQDEADYIRSAMHTQDEKYNQVRK